MQHNYNVVFVADGTAALTEMEHNATLCNMTMLFAEVMTTAEVVGAIESGLFGEIPGEPRKILELLFRA